MLTREYQRLLQKYFDSVGVVVEPTRKEQDQESVSERSIGKQYIRDYRFARLRCCRSAVPIM